LANQSFDIFILNCRTTSANSQNSTSAESKQSQMNEAETSRNKARTPAAAVGKTGHATQQDQTATSVELAVNRKPTTPPGSPPRTAHVHPKRHLVPTVEPLISSASNSETQSITTMKDSAANSSDDEVILHGQAKTTWRSAVAVAHFVGDGCMIIAKRARLDALSAVGLYFVAVRADVSFQCQDAPH
jgi:hypothetical protein